MFSKIKIRPKVSERAAFNSKLDKKGIVILRKSLNPQITL